MRVRRWLAPLLAAPALLLWSCADEDGAPPVEGTARAIATATPYAVQPQATIVAVTGPPTPAPTPTPRPTEAPTPAPQRVTHRVASGDNPSTIAARYGVTVAELLRANNITDPSGLQIGQVLVIPGQFIDPTPTTTPSPAPTSTPAATSTPKATTTATATPTPVATGEVYIVKSGDTASGIAAQFDITVAQLAAANNTTEAALRNLQIGQRLTIPR